MPVQHLPVFPTKAETLSFSITVNASDKEVFYFCGLILLYMHQISDLPSFRLITSQLYLSGHCKQSEIVRFFHVTKESVKRSVKKLSEEGAAKLFETPNNTHKRKPAVLTDEVLIKAQEMINAGVNKTDVAKAFGIKINTFHCAFRDGRLCNKKPIVPEDEISNKSMRSAEDIDQTLGIACTDVDNRIGAALGLIGGVETKFTSKTDVPNGGVLLALPYLLSNGLLKDIDKFFSNVKENYYRVDQIFLLIAMMSLARIKNPEQLKKVSPGEWGNLFGIDRIPEAKTLRAKTHEIASSPELYEWGSDMSRSWLNSSEFTGCLYVDGHVRVYHGKQTKLPKKYVSREKLCLRSMVDYWVNDTIGRPFFVITSAVTSGMTKIMKEDIVPRILNELTNVPSDQELLDNPKLFKFVLIFDRESYSYKFMLEMQKLRVACLTYNKFPGKNWNESDFTEREITLAHGNKKMMRVCEKTSIKTIKKDGENEEQKIEIREVRVLTKSGHQTSIVGTDHISKIEDIVSHMFGRWCQENFFKYMIKDFDIDRLIDYSLQPVDETKSIKSPSFKELERQVSKEAGKLGSLQRKLGKLKAEESKLDDKKNKRKLEKIACTMGVLLTEIALSEARLVAIKKEKKETSTHIEIKDLPENQKFSQLASPARFLVNTIKMIAYRAETAMAIQVKGWLTEHMRPKSRAILQAIYKLDADILVDGATSLTIRLHTSTNQLINGVVRNLCAQLNDAEIIYPGTELKITYSLNENKP